MIVLFFAELGVMVMAVILILVGRGGVEARYSKVLYSMHVEENGGSRTETQYNK